MITEIFRVWFLQKSNIKVLVLCGIVGSSDAWSGNTMMTYEDTLRRSHILACHISYWLWMHIIPGFDKMK